MTLLWTGLYGILCTEVALISVGWSQSIDSVKGSIDVTLQGSTPDVYTPAYLGKASVLPLLVE